MTIALTDEEFAQALQELSEELSTTSWDDHGFADERDYYNWRVSP